VAGIATEAEVEMVFRSHAGQVWQAVLAMAAGRREVADEATSEAFARLFDYREGVRDPVAWVFRTAFRIGSSELRREQALDREPRGADAVVEASSLPPDLTEALRSLSPDQRVAVFLHYYADLPVSEVARRCGAPKATIKVRLHRARAAMRVVLDGAEPRHV
jgi:RNA polymerase sigma-70 factor (ECF subfamily)